MYKGHRIAVVMPVHNEELFIERTISRVPSFVDLIIAVDDASSDSTWQRLSGIENGKLARLRHEKNLGVGAATKTGYRYALEASVDLIAVMDGDGQMDGRDLSRLLDRAISGVDYVKGNRFLHLGSIGSMPALRYIGNRILSWLTRRATGFEGSLDAQCGYTVIRRAALKRLAIDELYDRYGFLNEMLNLALGAGFKVESVPVRCVYADEVSGMNPLTSVPTILFLILRGWLRNNFSLNGRAARLAIEKSEARSAE
ncbi:MAG TPA: glycosyltransferase family 2 protein [Blastocatellia bacterium]|nr:glycosyltransferase family 2 protein [Blastocatellia bacterium]